MILQDIWLKQYKRHGSPIQNSLTNQPRDIIDEFLTSTISYEPYSSPMFDEFEHYCQASTSSLHLGPPVLEWWINNEARYPELSQWAYDIHSISAMSAECERVFSAFN